ncbi:MAG: response regulator transcription factor [Paludibacteraceae bacterium]|jgi:DNA-binding LytR/AlgR family response regulator|nr:response regulator transcription factor [Paludibacteraceae bacterium]MBP6437039.1 response regulator transcription factor [Paludibacteraceae bacterium]MBP8628349.1 response regulator transcription factor [Paludibacteraceae bacterium]MBP8781283.1 response regulator transcription factor [Paludibacteraceae bacterium]MBP9648649.1 response regulator transcription factor [Paludibacteraceae bacterium]
MKKIRCLLVDDEHLALEILELYCSKIDYLDVVGTCKNADEAAFFLQHNKVDLLLLDIQMPRLNGMEWYKNLSSKPLVIFCTAFQHFAVESYEVNAIDYLLKPFSLERFNKAIEKTKEIIEKKTNQETIEQSIFVRSDRKEIRVKIDDILFIQSMSNYYVVTTTEKKIIGYGSISTLESTLQAFNFIRIHRSYLVAKNKIGTIATNSIIVSTYELPIGRNYRKNIENIAKLS